MHCDLTPRLARRARWARGRAAGTGPFRSEGGHRGAPDSGTRYDDVRAGARGRRQEERGCRRGTTGDRHRDRRMHSRRLRRGRRPDAPPPAARPPEPRGRGSPPRALHPHRLRPDRSRRRELPRPPRRGSEGVRAGGPRSRSLGRSAPQRPMGSRRLRRARSVRSVSRRHCPTSTAPGKQVAAISSISPARPATSGRSPPSSGPPDSLARRAAAHAGSWWRSRSAATRPRLEP